MEHDDRWAGGKMVGSDRGNPDLGKSPEELALEREIAELAAQGREEERGAAADRLANLIMRKSMGSSGE